MYDDDRERQSLNDLFGFGEDDKKSNGATGDTQGTDNSPNNFYDPYQSRGSGGGGNYSPQYGNNNNFNPKKSDSQLARSNKWLKITCILLVILTVVANVVAILVSTYLTRNRPMETTSDANILAEAVSSNTINTVVAVKSTGSGVVSSGSGFFIHTAGVKAYIMTNKHVIENAINSSRANIVITPHSSGTEYNANIVSYSSDLDFAILEIGGITAGMYQTVKFADSDDLRYGSFVLAIGNPLGYGIAVTQGIVSIPRTTIKDSSGTVSVIQFDAAINPGNSGGPLFNKDSKVVGINTYKATQDQETTAEAMGYAIPSTEIVPFINKTLNVKLAY